MRPKRTLFSLLVAGLVGLVAASPALAVPPLPSSFYGTVKVNGENVPDGTVVRALIEGQVYAEGYTQTYEGDSVYSLDVPGDDPHTAARDGGGEGDTIQFEVGGVLADQTGAWHSGTNVELNLTASAAGPLLAPQPTPTPVPTQTPIPLGQPSPTPAAPGQPSPTPAAPTQPSPTPVAPGRPSPPPVAPGQPSPPPAAPGQPSPTPAASAQPSPTPVLPTSSGENDSSDAGLTVAVVMAAVAAGGAAWAVLRRR